MLRSALALKQSNGKKLKRNAQCARAQNCVWEGRLEKRREAGLYLSLSSQLRSANVGPNMTLREGCTSASGDARFSFFLSGWKDGVPQGRHRLCHHLFQLHHWRGREGERQRRVRRFGREASADRWPGEWSSITPGPREEPSSQPNSASRASRQPPHRACRAWATVFA